MNIQQLNTSEVSNIETVMADNEELDPPPPQDISNVFSAVYLSYPSPYEYRRAWVKAKIIRYSILYAG